VALLGEAKRQGSLEDELRKIERVPLIVVDEVGCAPRGAIEPGGMRDPPPAAATAG
jgi:DNA replication protein DnaC